MAHTGVHLVFLCFAWCRGSNQVTFRQTPWVVVVHCWCL